MDRNPFCRNERSCRCPTGGRDDEATGTGSMPEGSCGWCEVCGQPGHERPFPGLLPFRGAWCDRHATQLYYVHPLGGAGLLYWSLGIWSLVFFVVWIEIL